MWQWFVLFLESHWWASSSQRCVWLRQYLLLAPVPVTNARANCRDHRWLYLAAPSLVSHCMSLGQNISVKLYCNVTCTQEWYIWWAASVRVEELYYIIWYGQGRMLSLFILEWNYRVCCTALANRPRGHWNTPCFLQSVAVTVSLCFCFSSWWLLA